MKREKTLWTMVFLGLTLFLGLLASTPPANARAFSQIFSLPRPPALTLSPEDFFELEVPTGKKVLITDIYIRNTGGGVSVLEILEQRGPITFEVRYRFITDDGETTIINFTTGLRLGDEVPIAGSIQIRNAPESQANILPRVNGRFVP